MIRVGAAVIRQNGKILICRRGPGGDCAFLWEFPGGKVEAGESEQDCTVRECREELGVDIAILGLFAQVTHRYPDRQVHLSFFSAQLRNGEPAARVHDQIRFVTPGELGGFVFCPADEPVVSMLMEHEEGVGTHESDHP